MSKRPFGTLLSPIQKTDLKQLQDEFAAAYDQSVIESFIEKITDNRRQYQRELLGEGSHFASYLLTTQPIPLAVNIAHKQFLANQQPTQVKRWLSTIRKLNGLYGQIALIGPMVPISSNNTLALVMPYAPQDKSQAKQHWHPLDAHIKKTMEVLATLNLELDDWLQIRCVRGIPFIIDWSDLKEL